MASKYCGKCGAANAGEATFCKHCGVPLGSGPGAAAPPPSGKQGSPYPAPPGRAQAGPGGRPPGQGQPAGGSPYPAPPRGQSRPASSPYPQPPRKAAGTPPPASGGRGAGRPAQPAHAGRIDQVGGAPASAPDDDFDLGEDSKTELRQVAAPPPPPKPSRRKMWIAVGFTGGGLVLLLIVGLLLSIFVFKSAAEKSSSEVNSAITNYYKGKCTEAAKHFDGPKAEVVGECKAESADKHYVDMTMGKATANGDKGTVYAKVKLRDYEKQTRTNDYQFKTVKTKDGWKVAWNTGAK